MSCGGSEIPADLAFFCGGTGLFAMRQLLPRVDALKEKNGAITPESKNWQFLGMCVLVLT
jgi:hypothetical protein